MTIEEARYVIAKESLPWTLDSATFTSLSECQSIARVSMGTDTFFALFDGRVGLPTFILEESSLPTLLDWCLRMATTGGEKH